MTDNNLIFGMTHEEFKENILTSAIMAGVGFATMFLGLIVRNYVKEKIG